MSGIRKITALEEFATGAELQQFDLFAAAAAAPPPPAALPGEAPALAARRLLPAVSAYAVPGHVLGGEGLLLGPERHLFGKEDCLPADLRATLLAAGPPPAWVGALLSSDAETVTSDRPCLVPFQPETGYPRFLLDVLPRLYLGAVLADLGRPFPIVAPRGLPDWARRLLALYVAEADIVWYDPARQVVRAPAFVVPAIMQLDGHLHPALNLAAADLLRRAGAAAPPPKEQRTRLYLSYAAYEDGRLSRLANEPELAAILHEMGFRTLAPWRMTLAEQFAAYAAADCIFSERSAAACNALFAKSGARVGTIGPAETILERICGLRGHCLGTIAPEDEGAASPDARVRVDPAKFRAFLTQLLAETPAAVPVPARAPAAPPPLAAPASPAAAAPPGVEELPAGPSVGDLLNNPRVRTSVVMPGEVRQRRTPFHATPIDPDAATYGRLFADPGYRSYRAGDIRAVGLEAGTAIGATGLVAWDGRLLRDSMHSVDDWRAESIVAKRDLEHGVRFKRPVALPGRRLDVPALTAITGGWRNHAHWLTETLPRLCVFRRVAGTMPNLMLLVPEFGPSDVHARTLGLLGLPRERTLRLGEADVVTAPMLWTISGIDLFSVPRLCRIAAEELSAAVPEDGETGEDATRIYIRRVQGVRRLANFDEVAPVLDRFGFRVVAMEALTLDEQIRLMRGARHVVGEHGAGIANVMFCGAGARVLELFNPTCPQPAHWSLASMCDLDYGYVVGRHVPTSFRPEPDWNADYAVAPEVLTQALEAMVG